MSRTRLQDTSSKAQLQIGPTSTADAVGEYARLTGRDRELLALLARHQVFTTDQIHRLFYDSLTTAQHRLPLLARRGVLARFRHHQPRGTQAWRYTLGVRGAVLHATAVGATPPAPSRTTARVLALAGSPRLAHLLAVNDVFVSLTHHARTHPGRHLTEWWDEHTTTAAVGRIVRPDGYGEWTEHHPDHPRGRAEQPVAVGFFLELDRGTEPLPRVVGKLLGYRHLAEAGITRPVLFWLPTTVRERHLHDHPALRATTSSVTAGGAASAGATAGGGLVVATTAADVLAATGASPADAVWWRPGTPARVRLVDLAPPPAGPAPSAATTGADLGPP